MDEKEDKFIKEFNIKMGELESYINKNFPNGCHGMKCECCKINFTEEFFGLCDVLTEKVKGTNR